MVAGQEGSGNAADHGQGSDVPAATGGRTDADEPDRPAVDEHGDGSVAIPLGGPVGPDRRAELKRQARSLGERDPDAPAQEDRSGAEQDPAGSGS